MDQQTPALYSVIQARDDMGECLARKEEQRLEGRTISVAGCRCSVWTHLEVGYLNWRCHSPALPQAPNSHVCWH